MFNKKINIKFNKNIGVFSIFVFFATIIWFLNALNQEYNTEIELPVVYHNMPSNKANISELPSNLILNIKADGYDILKYQLKKTFIPTKLDIGSTKFNRLRDDDTNSFFILTYEFIDQIESQLIGDMKVDFIKPDTLHFRFTTFATKKVPVVLNADIQPKAQFIFNGNIKFNPDSVKISGPLSILDTLDGVKTEFFTLNSLSKNTIYNTSLIKIEHVVINPSVVEVNIGVEEYTEVRFKVPIESSNVPDSVYLHLFPNYVNVVCKVGFSNYEKVSATDFKAMVDYYSISKGVGSKINVQLVTVPENIYSYSFSPDFVEYIVEKK